MGDNSNKSHNKEGQEAKDEINREIKCLFGWIDSLDRQALLRQLSRNNLPTNGSVECLKSRLKSFMEKRKLASFDNSYNNVKTLFPYYVVLDFEATCNEVNPPDFEHEIIEFPAVLVNTEKLAIVDRFQAFVKPVLNPILTPFCKTLTGIEQEQVDIAAEFPEVLAQFEQWLSKHKLGTKNKFAMVTDGPWDMGRFLFGQCDISNIDYPNFGKKWINLRKCFSQFYKCDRLRLQLMLEKLGMEFEGHPHCGLDDATNIAHLLIRMIQDGASIDINERIQLRHKLTPKSNVENQANSSNKPAWPVKPLHNNAYSRTYSQALKDKQAAAEKEKQPTNHHH
ncbi:3'-5' exoribonuclease 1-like isoform X2 [Macrosteles quadrilineatus]|uniref:3'-5' exoribonuclease 1-like isoform X2 n=1 Tax=Macrosteles quadrilineatus TaxID=74068 RepID=UPI0023E145C4|nr:3'-5' exoribonuclease 1-like isoform X2 [Macrosteles quadrilineatus]